MQVHLMKKHYESLKVLSAHGQAVSIWCRVVCKLSVAREARDAREARAKCKLGESEETVEGEPFLHTVRGYKGLGHNSDGGEKILTKIGRFICLPPGKNLTCDHPNTVHFAGGNVIPILVTISKYMFKYVADLSKGLKSATRVLQDFPK